MVSIYLIEDCNGLKYVGSTKQSLNARFNSHKYAKKINKPYSSNKLNLEDCNITELECCNDENRKEREQYWIDKIDCINENKLYFDKKQWIKEYLKLEWYCSDCKCNLKLHNKSRHLKTKKHQLNTNNYLE